jgi:hypothetical protein
MGLEEGINRAFDILLEGVPDEERQTLREHLEALSILRTFDEERMPALLAVYYADDAYRRQSPLQFRSIRINLEKYSFAYWDNSKRGYVIDDAAGTIAEAALK